jgi:antibiotic biosynthesis monooxygenase (ABM) superfamily enzyme
VVLYVVRWDIPSKQTDEYLTWVRFGIAQTIAVPGVIELRSYRPVAGETQVVTTFQFEDFASWSAWFDHEKVQAVFEQMFAMVTNIHRELWEPSPIVPEPIRPHQSDDLG